MYWGFAAPTSSSVQVATLIAGNVTWFWTLEFQQDCASAHCYIVWRVRLRNKRGSLKATEILLRTTVSVISWWSFKFGAWGITHCGYSACGSSPRWDSWLAHLSKKKAKPRREARHALRLPQTASMTKWVMFVHTAYLLRILLIQSPVLLAWLESNLSTGKVLTGTPVEVFALNKLNTPNEHETDVTGSKCCFQGFLNGHFGRTCCLRPWSARNRF